MAEALWRLDELATACGADVDAGDGSVAGIFGLSIDTRTLRAGELFVALTDQRDGHEFVGAAFAKGAAAALVRAGYERRDGDGLLVRVDDPLRALERLGAAARARLSPEARIVAVTGSAGKTTTKEMLRTVFEALAPARTHASVKSYNNHWGVPLMLASMPATTRYGVFEIGMNHSGEIAALVPLVRPHVAVVTNVLPVHLSQFASVDEIAHAKAEIFSGLGEGGIAVLNADLPAQHVAILRAAAARRQARQLTFGESDAADVRILAMDLTADGSVARVATPGGEIEFRLGAAGRHLVWNAAVVATVLHALDTPDIAAAMAPLAALSAGAGRGGRSEHAIGGGRLLLIDESYNANPASMRVALAALALVPRDRFPRRVAVLGDMLELGPTEATLHAELAVDATAGADVVFAAGPLMRALFDALPAQRRGAWAESAAQLEPLLLDAIRAGDAVMIKGSNGSRMMTLAQALRSRYPEAEDSAAGRAGPDRAGN